MGIKLDLTPAQYLLMKRAFANYLWSLDHKCQEWGDTWIVLHALDKQALANGNDQVWESVRNG